MVASTWAKVSSTHRRPAITPADRATNAAVARAPGGRRADEMSPSGVRSSASATVTTARTASIGGSTSDMPQTLAHPSGPSGESGRAGSVGGAGGGVGGRASGVEAATDLGHGDLATPGEDDQQVRLDEQAIARVLVDLERRADHRAPRAREADGRLDRERLSAGPTAGLLALAVQPQRRRHRERD